jgi:bifunctional non-homologous end joining protein LigD
MKTLGKFIIHRHCRENEPVHFDLMLEAQKTLWTFRIEKEPAELLKGTHKALKIFDHDLKFLSYQGSVNKGKGTVSTADAGDFKILDKKENVCLIDFSGKILKGEFELCCKNNDEWEISKKIN